ncbi:MAG TPA: OmpA family protein [Methylotenera sp.]|nr:OmpA family protein [Methylotenera sp.]
MTSLTNHLTPITNGKYTYTALTWIIAIVLGIYLFWQWQHGKGPTYANSCCTGTTVASFNFTATSVNGYNATGDANNVKWLDKSAEFTAWLEGGSDWKLAGNASNVTLTGTVDSEEIKAVKGAEAQVLFGSDVKIDNQLSVKTVPVIATETVITAAKPEIAKIYFDTGKAGLPANASETLLPFIDWLKANDSAKAVISGYHDASGNLKSNQALSKNRAKAVSETLKNAGIDANRIELRKPVSTDGADEPAEARRVEVSIE